MRMARGLIENDTVIGNTYDKYGSRNPAVRWIMNGFKSALDAFVTRVKPNTIHEVGCGEGHWVMEWIEQGFQARGSDFSKTIIAIAQENAGDRGYDQAIFSQRSIYELKKDDDSADLVVCCEVLEHLESPEQALKVLGNVVTDKIVLSVPREPVWRILNCFRGKYLAAWGNTPGHLQHWSKSDFVNLVEKYFDVIEVKAPFPWTMVLAKRRG